MLSQSLRSITVSVFRTVSTAVSLATVSRADAARVFDLMSLQVEALSAIHSFGCRMMRISYSCHMARHCAHANDMASSVTLATTLNYMCSLCFAVELHV